jgi:segregation and condensation protein A
VTESTPAIAKINGELLHHIPKDLFIPPDALSVFLDAFEGPLDLLLYLIKKQKLDILQLPMQKITAQYMEYVELMSTLKIELAGEYLVMAALLAEIKSRLLLPKLVVAEDELDDPRTVLIRQLQEYEIFKNAAENLDLQPRIQRDIFVANAYQSENITVNPLLAEVSLQELAYNLQSLLKQAAHYEHHQIQREVLTTREKMTHILSLLQDGKVKTFTQVIDVTEGRKGVVVSFLAVLELVKEALISLIQNNPLGEIYLSLAE